jgi:hypothetical protein
MKAFNFFGLLGHKATVRVNRWTNSYMAKFKLFSVWVKMSGIPETMLHYQGFCEAASLIGKVYEIDMELYRSCEVIRAKVGVKDPRKIPSSAPLNDEEYIYDIYFELEDIVEEGEPMMGGILVSDNDTVKTSQDSANMSAGDLKRARELSQPDSSQTSKSPKKSEDMVRDGEVFLDDNGEQFVPSSQEEMDKNLQKELETRKILLDRQNMHSGGAKAVNEVNETFAEDSVRLEACDLDDDDDEHPDSFARQLGLGTQKIREINKKVEEEMGMESEMKRKEDKFNKENADPDYAMEEDDVVKLQNKKVSQLDDGDEETETVGKKKEKLGV